MISHRQQFLRSVAQTSDNPMLLEVTRAEGSKLFKPDSTVCIDLISGISVCNLGHSHPRIVKAIQDQAAEYMHLMVYGEFVLSPQVLLAKKLSSLLPEKFDNVYFVNSGSEAVEAGLKLAKRATGRSEIISCINAYHGSSHGALSVMGNEQFKQAFRPLLPDVRHIRFNDLNDLETISEKTACIIIEPIQGEAGIKIPDMNYMVALRKKCTDKGCLLIFDEVQTGFGRTGKMFGFQNFTIEPDLLLFAKGLGAGMPLGAVVGSKSLLDMFTNNPVLGHITTFGGHPVSCAASLAMLDELTSDSSIIESVFDKEMYIRANLKHELITEIRGVGLFLAVELHPKINLYSLISEILEEGVLIDFFLFNDRSLRMAPPLNIEINDLDAAIHIIRKVLDRKL